jgi:hypothetical protein
MTMQSPRLFRLALFFGAILTVASWSLAAQATVSSDLRLDILSSPTLSGTAGDFVTVQGTITNTGSQPISDVTTYLSLVDTQNKLPVDLEDWSAEKGLFIGTIAAGQALPLNWKIHFVKAGRYNLVIIASRADRPVPEVSNQTTFNVNPKRNLNPGKVLPVALGMPLVVGFLLLLLNYRRQRELD